MSCRPAVIAILLLITLGALLGADLPAWAHSTAPAADTSASFADTALDTTKSIVAATPAARNAPWLLGAAMLGILLASSRRSRRMLALALVVVLCVFAYEDGIHSVHHGISRTDRTACGIATASAHLTVATFAAPGLGDVPLPAFGFGTETDDPGPIARSICPVRGRAPPSPTL